MKETHHRNTQRQIANLIPMIELCLPLMEEVDRTRSNLSCLTERLEYLQKQAQHLNLQAPLADPERLGDRTELTDRDRPLKIEDTEFELDFLVNNLENTLLNLVVLKDSISNVVVLKERVEALQEERLDNITPERIYKLLEKQQQQSYSNLDDASSSRENPLKRLWHKAVNYKYFPRIIKGTAITTGIILCFSIGFYSSMEHQINETNNTQKIEDLKKPQDI